MASEETSLNSQSEKYITPIDSNKSQETKNMNGDDKTRLESMVTPEQVLSASVARKRRNVTKKRSQSSGSGGGRMPRDKTPVREIPANYNNDNDDDDDDNCDHNNETINEDKSLKQQKQNDAMENINTNQTTPPARPERRRSREIKQSELPKPKDETPEEILKLLNTAKRSLSSHRDERQSRKTTIEKKAIIKRSKSAPREFPIDDADLIESFKKAQQLSVEVGTAKINYTPSDEESVQTSSVTSEEDKSNLIKEKTPSKEKEKVAEKEEKQSKQKIIKKEEKQKIIKKEAKITKTEKKQTQQEKKEESEEPEEQYTASSASSISEDEIKSEEDLAREKEELKQKLKLIKKAQQQSKKRDEKKPTIIAEKEKLDKKLIRNFLKEIWFNWKQFIIENTDEYKTICQWRNRCIAHIIFLLIFCGIGGCIFRFTEGAFESFYKCGVKRVKRDFIDSLWYSSHNMREEDWKSLARRKLMDFEDQLHEAHEAGVHTYSGQRSWSFLNAVIYCLTVVTTIGYGHITPSTSTGRAITIVYAIFGIPMFLILLADFGKLFTRCIKFVWAFVRRLYYTGSCRKVRKTETVQDVMKGVQMVYDIATFRRPSEVNMEDIEIGQQQQQQQQQSSVTIGTPPKASSEGSLQSKTTQLNVEGLSIKQGNETPNTPAPSNFAIDDEFNLPVSVAIVILVIYLLSGACIYCLWENWTFFESFYFVFISMSTIGFGDYVPQHPMYMMASILYLVFGLALTSMCINVVQVKLSDTFRQASAKIGATIGLMAEDEASFTNPVPTTTEIAEVHTAGKKDKDNDK